jgi:hypothetical protein
LSTTRGVQIKMTQTNMIETERTEEKERSQVPIAFLAGLFIVLLVAGGIVFLSKTVHVAAPTAIPAMPFGQGERAYAARIELNDIHLARSSNLLNQQFTYVSGTLVNNGDRTVAGVTLTVDFRDAGDKVVLHDAEPVINSSDQPVRAGQSHGFQMTMEEFPDTWNQQMPALHITGLVLK